MTLDILSAGFPNYKIGLRKHTLLYKERSAIPGWIYAEDNGTNRNAIPLLRIAFRLQKR